MNQEQTISLTLDTTRTPQWALEHITTPWQPTPEGLNWLRSQPETIKHLLIRFPPKCLVRSASGSSHTVPASGCLGVVESYFENGLIGVMHSDDDPSIMAQVFGRLVAQCSPDSLQVVACRQGLTPNDVLDILGQGHGSR